MEVEQSKSHEYTAWYVALTLSHLPEVGVCVWCKHV